VYASNRLVAIAHRLHPLVQVPEILFQPLPVLLDRHTIHTHPRILSESMARETLRSDHRRGVFVAALWLALLPVGGWLALQIPSDGAPG
jgi:hypothetical protein